MHATGPGEGVKTENLTGRSTHAHVSGCAPCSTVVSDVHVSSNAPALAQGSVRVVSSVKTLRLLRGHSSIACLVATSWACLTVSLLFLTDWRQNQVSPASIPAAMAGLPKRLKSPRSLPLHASLSVGGNFVGGAVPMPFGISSPISSTVFLGGVNTSLAPSCICFSPHVFPSLLLGSFERFVRDGTHLLPVPLDVTWPSFFPLPCLSLCGTSLVEPLHTESPNNMQSSWAAFLGVLRILLGSRLTRESAKVVPCETVDEPRHCFFFVPCTFFSLFPLCPTSCSTHTFAPRAVTGFFQPLHSRHGPAVMLGCVVLTDE